MRRLRTHVVSGRLVKGWPDKLFDRILLMDKINRNPKAPVDNRGMIRVVHEDFANAYFTDELRKARVSFCSEKKLKEMIFDPSCSMCVADGPKEKIQPFTVHYMNMSVIHVWYVNGRGEISNSILNIDNPMVGHQVALDSVPFGGAHAERR
jgi:hypothetical protein